MGFCGYLKQLQSKYGVSNSEILEEFNKNNISITKSALSHKLNGERPITATEFEILISVLRPSGAEEQHFRRLYDILRIGENVYEEIQLVKEYIESFGNELTPFISGSYVDPEVTAEINSIEMLGGVIYSVLKKAWGKEKIRIVCQPEYKLLSDMLMCLSAQGKADVEQIVCFNNSVKSENNNYNIRCVKALNNIILRNPSYKVRYYYDDVFSHINSYSMFPYSVITSEYIVFFSSDFNAGGCIKRPSSIKIFTGEFDRIYANTQNLFEVIDNSLDLLRVCEEMERQTHRKLYVL